jgi:hypothetical protein
MSYIRTPEIRLKISLAKKGKKLPPRSSEHSEKIRLSKLGEKHPMFGKKLPPEWRHKISEGGKGKVMSPEARKKMSQSATGKKGTYGNLGKKMSLENRIRQGQERKGSKNHFWKGGVTKQSEIIRASMEYKDWRVSVFTRDNYTCTQCGIHSGLGKTVVLNADHIKPFSRYPELRFDINNGRTLCKPCHTLTDSYMSNFKKNYK